MLASRCGGRGHDTCSSPTSALGRSVRRNRHHVPVGHQRDGDIPDLAGRLGHAWCEAGAARERAGSGLGTMVAGFGVMARGGLRVLLLGAVAALVGVVSPAQASLTVVLDTVTDVGGGQYEGAYTVTLAGDQGLVGGSKL